MDSRRKAPSENIFTGKNVEQAYSYAMHRDIRVPLYGLCNVWCISTETAISPKTASCLQVPQTTRHPCEDSPAESPKTAYDQGLWRCRLFPPLYANAATRTGGVPFCPLRFSPQNSNCGRDNSNSRQSCMPRRVSSAPGASKTGIESTSRNGYLGSGASP